MATSSQLRRDPRSRRCGTTNPRYAEEAINFATAQGQEATVAIASTAMHAAEDAHINLANLQQYHFEGYEAARDLIEKERLELAKWETRLEEGAKDLGKREAPVCGCQFAIGLCHISVAVPAGWWVPAFHWVVSH